MEVSRTGESSYLHKLAPGYSKNDRNLARAFFPKEKSIPRMSVVQPISLFPDISRKTLRISDARRLVESSLIGKHCLQNNGLAALRIRIEERIRKNIVALFARECGALERLKQVGHVRYRGELCPLASVGLKDIAAVYAAP